MIFALRVLEALLIWVCPNIYGSWEFKTFNDLEWTEHATETLSEIDKRLWLYDWLSPEKRKCCRKCS
jgi:hypothetical protein